MQAMNIALSLLLLCGTGLAHADDAPQGLDIADSLGHSITLVAPRSTHIFLEASAAQSDLYGQPEQLGGTSLDYRGQYRLTPNWQLSLSNRLDLSWRSSQGAGNWINTLREASLSWQPNARTTLDFGRINAQFGEAIAFNPTDLFREGALRSITSVLPANLRNNRQGTLMLRAQRLWEGGAATAVLAPSVAGSPSSAPLSLDLASTNPRDRWLLAVSQRLANGVTPQLVLAGSSGDSAQVGLNLSFLPAPSVVAYLETNAGRKRSTLSATLGGPDDTAWRSQLASGLTWNPVDKFSLTLEYDYDQTGNQAEQRAVLARLPASVLAAFRAEATRLQQLPNRNNLFVNAGWNDFLAPGNKLTALMRQDPDDNSRQYWLELRHRLSQLDLAVQYQNNSGAAGSTFGTLQQLQLLLDFYF